MAPQNPNVNQAQVFDPRTNNSDYFWYAASVSGIVSTAPIASTTINLDADSYFYCVALTTVSQIQTSGLGAPYTESTAPLPLVTLNIQDSATGKSLMNQPLLLPGFTGDGKRPYRFVRPRVFNPNASIQLSFNGSQMASGTTYGIQLILHGYKVYLS